MRPGDVASQVRSPPTPRGSAIAAIRCAVWVRPPPSYTSPPQSHALTVHTTPPPCASHPHPTSRWAPLPRTCQRQHAERRDEASTGPGTLSPVHTSPCASHPHPTSRWAPLPRAHANGNMRNAGMRPPQARERSHPCTRYNVDRTHIPPHAGHRCRGHTRHLCESRRRPCRFAPLRSLTVWTGRHFTVARHHYYPQLHADRAAHDRERR